MELEPGYTLAHHGPHWKFAHTWAPETPAEPPAHGLVVLHTPWPDVKPWPVAGVSIFETTGSGCVFEFLWANGGAAMRVRHRAVEHVIRSSLVYCKAIGKQAIMLNSVKGVRMMLERMGVGGRTDLELLVSHLEVV